MPSIARCRVSDCKKSNECYRFMCKPDPNYEPFNFRNICNEENQYERFWMIRDYTNDIEKKDEVNDEQKENETGETT